MGPMITARARALAARLEGRALDGLIAGLRALGPARASDLGGAVARTLGPLLPVSRVAHANLRRVMPELDRAARRRIVRGVWDNLGRTVAELPHLADLRENTAEGPGWEMVGGEHLRAQAARGGPAIFVSGHLGNWEMMPPAVAAYGMVFSSMYRAASDVVVDARIKALRKAAIAPYAADTEVKLFPKGSQGARQAVAHLARGGFLGLLVDQKMNDGVEARLFGEKAMTAPAASVLALRFRCPVIPGHVQRVGPARFRLVCEAPLPLPDTGDARADAAALTQTINDCLERWIRARPESWLWLHRRWPKAETAPREPRRT